MRQQFSGMIRPCHGRDPGSNPGCRIFRHRNLYILPKSSFFQFFGPVAQSGLERWSYKTTFGTIQESQRSGVQIHNIMMKVPAGPHFAPLVQSGQSYRIFDPVTRVRTNGYAHTKFVAISKVPDGAYYNNKKKILKNEKKLTKMEKERPNEMEMAT